MEQDHRITLSPRRFSALVLDLDGVVTRTARVHAAAWKEVFDDFLRRRAATAENQDDPAFRPFSIATDYFDHVDGKPRYDGVRDFLAARGIDLPHGDPNDPIDRDTVCSLGNRKNKRFLQALGPDTVEVYDSTVAVIRAARNAGLSTAVVSSSRNCRAVLEAAGLSGLFDARVDGRDLERMNLAGKPAPDMFIEAVRRLDLAAERAVGVEDSSAGVRAARAAGYGYVVGVDRNDHADVLAGSGADVVVGDLSELSVDAGANAAGPSETAADGVGQMSTWKITYDEFDPDQERLRETLTTVGNGYFATRGAAPESKAGDTHYPGTYLAGCFNRLETELAGRTVENESLVNAPNWLWLTFRIDGGDWFDLSRVDVLDYRQALDLKFAVWRREVRFRDDAGRHTRLTQQRFASMDDPHLGAMETRIHAEDWSGTLEIETALDGRVANTGVPRYRALDSRHLAPRSAHASADYLCLEMETNQSHILIAEAARHRFRHGGVELGAAARPRKQADHVAHRVELPMEPGDSVTVEKVVAIYTSRDHAISEPALEASNAVREAADFDALLARHQRHWRQLWQRFQFDIDQHPPEAENRTECILRLHILHLIQTTSPHVMNLDVGVPARGLHGEAYRGHIFWDELFVFPLFNLRMPEITRALLRYRYRRLGEARRAAAARGYRGAMYPWQSGSNGREESQELHLNPKSGNWIPDHSSRQRHISSAVVYNVWHYFQVTRDMEFLAFYGAEMILEVARFWASLASWNESRQRYEILGVMGPDEYHDAYPGRDEPGLNNNAYTNLMAVWVLLRALELRQVLPTERLEELVQILDLSKAEFDEWEKISAAMYVPFHDDGIISQFDGYDELAEFDWPGYRRKYRDIARLDRILEAENDTTNRYKVSKQADVLMLFYLFSAEELAEIFTHLGYAWDPDLIPRNIDYYQARTSHGSTLSRVAHSWVLARANRQGAWPLFTEALESDIRDVQGGTTREGIHTGAMAGTVDLIQRCFTGLETRGDVLWLNPCLPDTLDQLALNIHYRAHVLALNISRTVLRICVEPSDEPPIHIGVRASVHEIRGGEVREFLL